MIPRSYEQLNAILPRMTCLSDYEKQAKRDLDIGVWAYLNAGAADGYTHELNKQAFRKIALLPRVLKNVNGGSTVVELFGRRCEHPIFIAPTAYHALAHPEAEQATAMAAAALQTGYVASTLSSMSLEAIAEASQHVASSPLWFQLYLQSERDVSLDLIRRAERAGYQAIVITVDAPIQGLRNEDQRQGFLMPSHVQPVNLAPYTSLNGGAILAAGESLFHHALVTNMADWEDIRWLVAQTQLPVLLKGILNPLDVEQALAVGAAGIIVSNHGGRALDSVPATLDVLPVIVAEVNGRVPVLMDGGIRRGTDVLKALALGATAVMIGRPILHGLTVAGISGVAHVLNLLRSELEAAMVLTGCKTLADVNRSLLL